MFEIFDDYYHTYTNLNGEPVKRTRDEYPYSYDSFVVWKGDYKKGESNTVDSDRLRMWDSEKYDKCSMEVWNSRSSYFDEREPEEIERFLSLYLDMSIKLTAIVENCNASNGYPYWSFYYELIK